MRKWEKEKVSGRMPFFLDENEGFFIRFLDMVNLTKYMR